MLDNRLLFRDPARNITLFVLGSSQDWRRQMRKSVIAKQGKRCDDSCIFHFYLSFFPNAICNLILQIFHITSLVQAVIECYLLSATLTIISNIFCLTSHHSELPYKILSLVTETGWNISHPCILFFFIIFTQNTMNNLLFFWQSLMIC